LIQKLRLTFLRKKPPLVPDPGQRVRLHAGHGRWRGRFRAVSYPYTDAWGVVVVRVAEEVERQIAALTQFKEELDGLYERARKQPAPEPQQGGYCHIIETGTAEIKAGTSQVSDYSHREA